MRKNEAKWIENRERWQINVRRDGERKTFTSSTPGKKGKITAERKADIWLESAVTGEKMRFETLWCDFLEEKRTTTGTANYNKLEQMGRLWLLPRLKMKKLPSVTAQDFQDCINDAYKKGLSKKTCSNIRTTVSTCCRYAKKRKLPLEVPEGLTVPMSAPTGDKKILQPADLKTLFSEDCITHYNKPTPCHYIHAWRFLVLTGLRRGELCGLKWADVQEGVVHIKRSVNSLSEVTQGKNDNARRYFALTSHASAVLEAQRKMLNSSGIISPWVFPADDGGVTDPNSLYKRWRTYRAQHGIDCNLHEMRHTLISIAKADVPEQLLKRVVGHSKGMDTFGVYGHDVDGELERVANILDTTFDKLLK